MNDEPQSFPSLDEIKQQLAETNDTFPGLLAELPEEVWPEQKIGTLLKIWRSKTHIVRLTRVSTQMFLSIQRAELKDSMEFIHDEMTWVELMQQKAQAGFADAWCCECYPPHEHVWHELNSRDLWILPAQPEFGWRMGGKPAESTSAVNGTNGQRVEFVSDKCSEAPPAVMDALMGRAQFMGGMGGEAPQ